MATILSLPCEICRIILNHEFIQLEDVLNLSYTCKRLQDVIADATNEAFWQEKLFKRLPYFKKIYDMLELTNINYEEQARLNMETRKKLHQYLSKMPETHYCMTTFFAPEEIEDFLPVFYPPAGAHPMSYYYLMDELTTILQKECKDDLGEQHYAHKLLYCIQIYYLRYEWQNFMSKSKQQQTFETAFGIINQWFVLYYKKYCVRNIYKHIVPLITVPLMWNKRLYLTNMLDTYAEKVFETIQKEYPKHPVLSVSKEQFLFWKYNCTDYHWNKRQGQQILEAIYIVILFNKKEIFESEAISKDVTEFPTNNSNNSICMFYRCFSPHMVIMPNTIYKWIHFWFSITLIEGLARRFGIWISKNGYFLSWKSQYGREEDDHGLFHDLYAEMDIYENYDEITYIQPQISAKRLDYTFIAEEIKNKFAVSPHDYSFDTYHILQIRLLLEPDNTSLLWHLYDYCKVTNANSSILLDALSRCKDPHKIAWNLQQVVFPEFKLDTYYWPPYLGYVQQRQIIPKYRTEDINRTVWYAVGMLVSLTEERPLEGRGIICGWYTNFDSLPQIAKNRICKYNEHTFVIDNIHKYNVPYYKVIRDKYVNGLFTRRDAVRNVCYYDTEYICQNYIQLTVLANYLRTECGQYFSHFDEKHNVYVPNKMLASEYPDDREYTINYLKEFPNASSYEMKPRF